MNRFLRRIFAFAPTVFLLTAPYAHAQPLKKASSLLRAKEIISTAKPVSPALQRHIAFARQSHFAKRSFIFSDAETRRIRHALIRQQGLSPQEARRLILLRPARLAAQFKIPALQKHKAVFLTDFSAVKITRARRLPSYPAALFPGDMARGMVLKKPEESLQEIFTKGLSAARCGIDAWTGKRLIFMTNSTQIALKYARTEEPGVPVIVHIAGFDGETNHMAESERDIPAAQIIRVSALLNIGGKPAWGQITPAANGFLFHPYKNGISNQLYDRTLRLVYPDEQ